MAPRTPRAIAARPGAVHLTAAGALSAIVSAGLLAAAYLLGYPRLGVLGTAGLVALAVSALAVSYRPDLEMSRDVFPVRVTRNAEPAVALLTVRNRSRWAVGQVDVREAFGDLELPVAVPYLPRGARREIAYQLPTDRRGVHTVGPLTWQRSGSFGFFRRQQTAGERLTLYVHPVTHPMPLGAALRAQRWDSATSDAAPEGTITFHRLREYLPGDDLRLIHWRSSARLDTLMVRHNIDVSAPQTTVLLITDPAAYPRPELFEEAVEVAASAVIGSASAGLPVRLWTSQGTSLAGRGGHDDPRLFLDFLAGLAADAGVGVVETAGRLEQADPGGILVVAAGRLSDAEDVAIRRAAFRYDDAVLAMLADAGPASGALAGDLGLTIIPAGSAAGFCARWSELARR
jgi:uncharacterized protein (DUF58 family)